MPGFWIAMSCRIASSLGNGWRTNKSAPTTAASTMQINPRFSSRVRDTVASSDRLGGWCGGLHSFRLGWLFNSDLCGAAPAQPSRKCFVLSKRLPKHLCDDVTLWALEELAIL